MILVAGATGSLGGRIVRALRERGEEVRALVRASSDRRWLQDAGVALAIGDLREAASLEAACRGADVLVSTASASRRGDDTVEHVDLQGNLNLLAAAGAAGVRHVVFVSTLGAAPEHPVPVFRAKGVVEQRLRESDLAYTILQPNAFMDVWFPALVEQPLHAGLPVTLVGEGRRRHSFIAEQDVAAFAVAAIGTEAARNATLFLGGPEALTLREVVGEYGRAMRREIPIRSVAPGEPIPGLPEPVWAIAAALETYDSVVPMEETAARFGVTLTTASAFIRARQARDPSGVA